jgi:ribosomal protein L37AE/L43A
LTQRQQREIAKKAREETQKMQAEKEKELAKTRERERLFVCDKCFKYFAAAATYTVHTVRLCFTLASSFSDLTVNGR